jgi:EF-P beta-lysylation protein EpmB
MIPLYEASVDTCDWQKHLSEIIRTPAALLQVLNLSESLLDGAGLGHQSFPIRVPRPYLERMELGNPDDPLLRQVLPLDAESLDMPGYVLDPLAELSANKTPGIVHKYQGRVLLISATSCAINCRYCFRRHFPYSDNRISRRQWDQQLEYIRQDTSLKEVILSGGDPWMQTDAQLFELVAMLESIEHIKRLRIHTRLPVVIPSRVTDALVARLGSSRLKVVVVIHANHANELDQSVAVAMAKLTSASIWVLNQSVLLRGVNDQAQALIDLSERLFDIDVKPYYLHLLDPVTGGSAL